MKGNVSDISSVTASDSHENGVQSAASVPSVYIYPITPYTYKKGSNNYILKVKESLNGDFKVVNTVTRLGIIDILLKLHKCDIIYFNWIADIADKRLGYFQIPVLFIILGLCKIFNIRIAWFVHNDISHSKKNWMAKKIIRQMMIVFSDVILSHSKESTLYKRIQNIKVFEHPVEEMQPVQEKPTLEYDVLIWGSVSPYKGVLEFARYNYSTPQLNDLNMLVTGKFISLKFYQQVMEWEKQNLTVINKVLEESELADLFSRSRYVLFCYTSSSVLSSAALCKTLSYGKTIIGPNKGAFKELAGKGLLYTYDSFEQLADLLQELKATNKQIDKQLIKEYVNCTSWHAFKNFLVQNLNDNTVTDNIAAAPAYNSIL